MPETDTSVVYLGRAGEVIRGRSVQRPIVDHDLGSSGSSEELLKVLYGPTATNDDGWEDYSESHSNPAKEMPIVTTGAEKQAAGMPFSGEVILAGDFYTD